MEVSEAKRVMDLAVDVLSGLSWRFTCFVQPVLNVRTQTLVLNGCVVLNGCKQTNTTAHKPFLNVYTPLELFILASSKQANLLDIF